MVFTLLRSKTEKKQQLIDTEEAFNLWSILSSKYQVVEKLKIWENFAHDHDFKIILNKHNKELQTNISILESQLKKYSIKGPSQNRYAITVPGNSEVVNDEFIAKDSFIYIQEHIENMLRAFRTTITNDAVRAELQKMAIRTIELEDLFVKYMKSKGWIEIPPLFNDVRNNINEKLTTTEAYHLWDQLAYRYDNLRQTSIFQTFTFDGDLKVIFKRGIDILEKQSNILQKELEYFGIPLPARPSIINAPPANTELLDDDYMYRMILIGIKGSLTMHAQALKQCTFNDRIRGLFKKLLLEEITFLDNYVKYGKTKGWLNSVPVYRT